MLPRSWLRLAGVLLLLGFTCGCLGGERGTTYHNRSYGCSFIVPAGWEYEEPREREGVLTLKIAETNGRSSYMVVTVFPAELYSREEAVDEAEKLLQNSLYALEGSVQRQEYRLSSGESGPLLRASAGKKEKIGAAAAVLYGSRFHALAALISAAEDYGSCEEAFQTLLDTLQLK